MTPEKVFPLLSRAIKIRWEVKTKPPRKTKIPLSISRLNALGRIK
jgi:hypothetical protein